MGSVRLNLSGCASQPQCMCASTFMYVRFNLSVCASQPLCMCIGRYDDALAQAASVAELAARVGPGAVAASAEARAAAEEALARVSVACVDIAWLSEGQLLHSVLDEALPTRQQARSICLGPLSRLT